MIGMVEGRIRSKHPDKVSRVKQEKTYAGWIVVTLTAPRTRSEPAPSPAPAGPTLMTSMACMTDGSSPVRKNKSVGSDEVNDARPETDTGTPLSSETLNAPESGVVRPVRPTAEPDGRIERR